MTDMHDDVETAIVKAYHHYTNWSQVAADAAIAACEPDIRADERRKVLAEAARMLDAERDDLAEPTTKYHYGMYLALAYADAARIVRSLRSDSKGDE